MPGPVVAVPFLGDDVGVDVVRLSDLRQRLGPRLDRHERLDFWLHVLTTEGSGTHAVDVKDVPCRPDSLVTVAPGRVHRFCKDGAFEAELVLVHPRALDRAPRTAVASVVGGAEHRALRLVAGLLRDELARHDTHAPVLRALAATWVGMCERLPTADGHLPRVGSASDEARCAAYLQLLDEHWRDWRDTAPYARRLGCSPRTLARSTLSVRSRSPRQLREERTMLEARRLLVLGDETVESVARALGWTQATNFSAAFRRVVGLTPGSYRDGHR